MNTRSPSPLLSRAYASALLVLCGGSGCSGGSGGAAADHCGTILADEVWSAAEIHTVTCDVALAAGSLLTIEAGAVVEVGPDASLSVGCDAQTGALSIEGTAEAPVLLTSTTGITGTWNYLRFCEGSDPARSAVRHTTLEHAGAYDNVTTSAGLVVQDTEVTVESLTLQDNRGHGFTLSGTARLAEGSTGLTVTGSRDDAGQVSASGAGSVPADLLASGNGADLVRITGGTLSVDDTWAGLSVPWFIDDRVILEGSETTAAVLTIAPGATVYFNDGEDLQVGNSGRPAGLLAVGTAAAPITFGAAGSPDPGAWGGLVIAASSVDAETRLEHVVISHAQYGVTITDAAPTLDQVTLTDSLYCGLYLLGDAAPVLGEITYLNSPEEICR